MKTINIKSFFVAASVAAMVVAGISSCTIDDQIDPNNPSQQAIEANATIDELNNLVTGMEAEMRSYYDTYLDGVGVIGRDFYRFSGADPRFTSDLLGKAEAALDDNTYYTVNPYNARYTVVRNGWILRHAIVNTTAALTIEEKNGYNGFAETIQALQLLLNLNMQYDNGIRSDEEDPNNLGAFLDYHGSLDRIMGMLDDGYTDLSNGGDAFRFVLSHGFDEFNTPSTFAKFNRALAARVQLYHGEDPQMMLDLLNASFFDLSGSLSTGPSMVYSISGGDLTNAMFYPLNSSPGGNARCTQNSWVTDAEAGDLRLSKSPLRDVPAFQDDLSSDYDVYVWQSNVDPISIIRNEELILIYAEAQNLNGNSTEAVNAINIIRSTAGGLGAYAGATDQTSLTNEILNQRRYSLFAEGHRWIDMRRYNKLGELPIDRPDDDVFIQFPRPSSEL